MKKINKTILTAVLTCLCTQCSTIKPMVERELSLYSRDDIKDIAFGVLQDIYVVRQRNLRAGGKESLNLNPK
jgi:hypothetical protein